MLKPVNAKRFLLDWLPSGAGSHPAGLAWLLALGWWLVLGLPLRRSLRPALGGAVVGWPCAGPPTKPRRPKPGARRAQPRLIYPSAA
jgi:hypothetical protein